MGGNSRLLPPGHVSLLGSTRLLVLFAMLLVWGSLSSARAKLTRRVLLDASKPTNWSLGLRDPVLHGATRGNSILTSRNPHLFHFNGTLPLVSSNGLFRADVQKDGNLVVNRGNTTTVWSTQLINVTEKGPFLLWPQADGNVVIYSQDKKPIWSTNTSGLMSDPYLFYLMDSGRLVLYGGINTSAPGVIWSSVADLTTVSPTNSLVSPSGKLSSKSNGGGKLVSSNNRYSAVMQPDGNFVLYRTHSNHLRDAPLWSTQTDHIPGSIGPYELRVQGDGHLGVYGNGTAGGGTPLWISAAEDQGGGSSPPPYLLYMQDDGNLVLYSGYNTSEAKDVWSTRTYSGYAGDYYSHDAGAQASNPSWQAQLCDSLSISGLSIPGTHDTMTFASSDLFAGTQTMTLRQQLDSGIRALDIRCRVVGQDLSRGYYGSCMIYHGWFSLSASLDDVFTIIAAFLDDNPSEFILMRLKDKECGPNVWPGGCCSICSNSPECCVNYDAYQNAFEEVYLQSYLPKWGGYIWNNTQLQGKQGSYLPKVGEIRKKIVILQDFTVKSETTLYGIRYSDTCYKDDASTSNCQDEYILTSNWDLYKKWEAVKSMLKQAAKGPMDELFINYLSGSTGSTPFFVASGKVSPDTNAPCLSTGLISPFFDKYPDFPRVACVGSWCTICFRGTNYLTGEWKGWAASKDPVRVGIIYSDFPGGDLINRIIDQNPLPRQRCSS